MPAFDGELGFGFLLDGTAVLQAEGDHPLEPASAFVIPPGQGWSLLPRSADVKLLWATTNGLSGQSA